MCKCEVSLRMCYPDCELSAFHSDTVYTKFTGGYDEYTGGLSEEEQMWRAMERSLYENGSDVPPYPSYQSSSLF